jgi:hypothetical protein
VCRSNLLLLLTPFLAVFSFGQSRFPGGVEAAQMSNTRLAVSLPLALEANRGHAATDVDFVPRTALGRTTWSGESMSLPLAFETNRGQAAPDIDFIARGHGYGVLLRANRVTLTLGRIGQQGDQMAAPDLVEMTLTGASPTAKAMGEQKPATTCLDRAPQDGLPA